MRSQSWRWFHLSRKRLQTWDPVFPFHGESVYPVKELNEVYTAREPYFCIMRYL